MYLGVVHGGQVFRRYPMTKPYAQIGETPVVYNGPHLPDMPEGTRKIALFGPKADLIAGTFPGYALTGIDSERVWSKATSDLVQLLYDPQVVDSSLQIGKLRISGCNSRTRCSYPSLRSRMTAASRP